ncbi:methylated-DNA--[protein]-cysteine S-methyltransferase [Hyphomicrobium sp.]|uniref:methylated-DNA--[protein]-cysteine S-methyltransferase n=1 Tax=Hyphomicrobium sp. TaxID=82 RepID=UPI002FDF55EC
MSDAYNLVPSPVGTLKLVASPRGLVALLWPGDSPTRVILGELTSDPAHPVLREAETQLGEYFAGARTKFDIAKQIGVANGARAVGAANGRNPISIIVPCHRAIGGDGALTGFAGGLETKRFLLSLEGRADSEELQQNLPL